MEGSDISKKQAVLRAANAYVMSALFYRRWPGETEPISWQKYYQTINVLTEIDDTPGRHEIP